MKMIVKKLRSYFVLDKINNCKYNFLIFKTQGPVRNELKNKVIVCLKKLTCSWVLKIEKLYLRLYILSSTKYVRSTFTIIFINLKSPQNRRKLWMSWCLESHAKTYSSRDFVVTISNRYDLIDNEVAEGCYYRNLNFRVYSFRKRSLNFWKSINLNKNGKNQDEIFWKQLKVLSWRWMKFKIQQVYFKLSICSNKKDKHKIVSIICLSFYSWAVRHRRCLFMQTFWFNF